MIDKESYYGPLGFTGSLPGSLFQVFLCNFIQSDRKVPFKIVPHRKEHGAGLLRVPSIPVQRGHISSLVLPPHSQPGENGQKTVKAPVVMVLGFCWHLQGENSYYNGIPDSPDSARRLD